jgi:CheY-like chemotaxis protein
MSTEGQPQVLVVGRESRAIPFVRILLSSMRCKCVIAPSTNQALDFIREKPFDAVLVDVRCPEVQTAQLIDGIKKARPELFSRVLAIIDQDTDPAVIELVKEPGIRRLHANLLMEALWPVLEPWLRRGQAAYALNLRAKLIFDSWHRPLAGGVRNTQDSGRHLIYQSLRLVIHLWAEDGTAPNSIKLTGQIQDAVEPLHRFENVPVTVTGGKAAARKVRTNEFGEFDLEAGIQENITLSVAISKEKNISIPLPALGRKH